MLGKLLSPLSRARVVVVVRPSVVTPKTIAIGILRNGSSLESFRKTFLVNTYPVSLGTIKIYIRNRFDFRV
jgi:hypothetical protein